MATPSPTLDMDKVNAFIGQFVADLGAAVHTGMVVIAENLGLYKALAGGPMSSSDVEPFANDELKDNLNPVGRVYYSFSTCFAHRALSQEVGLCLGAQAGESRIRDVVTSAKFTRFRRAAETPFNIVYEARP